jgi:alginate O-acetyltransferase complex protein AlgI
MDRADYLMNSTLLRLILVTIPILGIYYMLPRRAQNVWLLVTSWLFYVWWSWQQALILAVLTLLNFFAAQMMERGERSTRLWRIAGITFNVLALVFFKYKLIESISKLLSTEAGLRGSDLVVPLGLSFIVLQAIAYLVEVGNGRVRASRSLVDFALYLAYFPRIIAGPVERPAIFFASLNSPRVVDNTILARNFTRIMVGLVRTLIFARLLNVGLPKTVFTHPSNFSTPALWVALLTYAFVLYNDFAGYTDIVRGLSGMFGLELPPNFERPYFSRSFTEFWNRWHMSFSFWLRDFIFFPFSRKLARSIPDRQNPLHRILPPITTMLISGLWHVAAPTMLLWGLLHGVYLAFGRVPLIGVKGDPNRVPVWRQRVNQAVVFFFVLLAWVPFRVPTLQGAVLYKERCFTGRACLSGPMDRVSWPCQPCF